jgi:ABC-type nitrate/sulfonate/bicarbonate transport system ATPase subunit
MFQNSSLYPWLTIEKNIAFGLRAQNKYREYKDNGEVRRWLRAMGLDGFENALPGQLSGGMTQRAALARSLILRPKILLLDEPLGALDAFTRGEMQNVVRDVWERQGITVLMVSHDVDEAIFLSAKIVVLTKSPCEVKEVIINNLRGESDRTSPEYLTSRSHILSSLNEYG